MYKSSLWEAIVAIFRWLWPHLFVMVTTHLKRTTYSVNVIVTVSLALKKDGQPRFPVVEGKRSSEFKEALFYGILLL